MGQLSSGILRYYEIKREISLQGKIDHPSMDEFRVESPLIHSTHLTHPRYFINREIPFFTV